MGADVEDDPPVAADVWFEGTEIKANCRSRAAYGPMVNLLDIPFIITNCCLRAMRFRGTWLPVSPNGPRRSLRRILTDPVPGVNARPAIAGPCLTYASKSSLNGSAVQIAGGLKGMITRSKAHLFLPNAILLSLLAGSINAGQESNSPKRIEIKAGGPAVTLEGTVSKSKEMVYVFSAKAGQKFTGRITKKDGNTGFDVTDPSGEGLPEEENDFNTGLTGTLPKTGDYKINVSTFETRASKYTLVVRVY